MNQPPPDQPPYEGMDPHQRRHHLRTQNMMAGGAILAFIGIIVYLQTARAATVCSSALVSAFDSQCGYATTIHDLSLIGIVAGIALAIAGIVVRHTGTRR